MEKSLYLVKAENIVRIKEEREILFLPYITVIFCISFLITCMVFFILKINGFQEKPDFYLFLTFVFLVPILALSFNDFILEIVYKIVYINDEEYKLAKKIVNNYKNKLKKIKKEKIKKEKEAKKKAKLEKTIKKESERIENIKDLKKYLEEMELNNGVDEIGKIRNE